MTGPHNLSAATAAGPSGLRASARHSGPDAAGDGAGDGAARAARTDTDLPTPYDVPHYAPAGLKADGGPTARPAGLTERGRGRPAGGRDRPRQPGGAGGGHPVDRPRCPRPVRHRSGTGTGTGTEPRSLSTAATPSTDPAPSTRPTRAPEEP
ncbi:hypothetical protein [Kitasatospora phosalacinea]|uniref:Uncharacterized protein n=1 Tax=Kitasatospora phosalacinea TaxID=2065 RepID=A0ABW6GG00_9ACTN